jgi:hypothetical protein
MLWLSKHLVIMFRKEIFKNENQCLMKPRVMFWKTRFNRLRWPVKPSTPVRPPPRAGQTAPRGGNSDSTVVTSKIVEDEVGDWRTPLVKYLQDPKSVSDRKVRRWALKFILDENELYRRTTDGLLLKCLGPDQARLAMAEVHEGICGTHQSTPKMKWLLRRVCFYWPTMIAD